MDIDDFGEPRIYKRYIPSWYVQQINPDKLYPKTLSSWVEPEEVPIKDE